MLSESLAFEASSGTRIGAWGLLGFWALFLCGWVYVCVTGPAGPLAWAWGLTALAGLVLQAFRVRGLRQPLLVLGEQQFETQNLIGRPLRFQLAQVARVAVLRRSTRSTLYLSFVGARGLRGRWLHPLGELEDPRGFLAELVARVPEAQIDGSVEKYLRNEEPGDDPRSRQDVFGRRREE